MCVKRHLRFYVTVLCVVVVCKTAPLATKDDWTDHLGFGLRWSMQKSEPYINAHSFVSFPVNHYRYVGGYIIDIGDNVNITNRFIPLDKVRNLYDDPTIVVSTDSAILLEYRKSIDFENTLFSKQFRQYPPRNYSSEKVKNEMLKLLIQVSPRKVQPTPNVFQKCQEVYHDNMYWLRTELASGRRSFFDNGTDLLKQKIDEIRLRPILAIRSVSNRHVLRQHRFVLRKLLSASDAASSSEITTPPPDEHVWSTPWYPVFETKATLSPKFTRLPPEYYTIYDFDESDLLGDVSFTKTEPTLPSELRARLLRSTLYPDTLTPSEVYF